MIRLSLVAVFISFLFQFQADARGAAPRYEEVSDWLVRDLAASRQFPDLPLMELYFSVEFHFNTTAEEVRALSNEVGDDARHPRFGELQMKRAMLGRQTQLERFRAWALDGDNWRINAEVGAETPVWVDTILREHWACMSSQGELAVFDPRAGFPQNRSVADLRSKIVQPVNDLLYGALRTLPRGAPVPDGFTAGEGRFRIAYRGEDPGSGVWTVEGRWLADERRGLPEKIVQTDPSANGGARTAATAHDWHADEESGRWFASEVMKFRTDGSLERIIRFEGAARVTRDEFERVTALPSPVRGDAVRGPVDYACVHDFRANPEDMIRRPTGEELPPVSRWRLSISDPAFLRAAGWTVFGGLAAAFVILYVRRRVAG